MTLPITLYTVSAVIILDSGGGRILSKYYKAAGDLATLPRKQQAFESSIHEKTTKPNDEIVLINSFVVLYKTNADVTVCVVGKSEDCNELLLFGAVETIFETLQQVVKPQLDKKSLLDNFDLLAVTIDQVIDNGILIESESSEVVAKIGEKGDGGGSSKISSFAELKQTAFSSALNFAKSKFSKTYLK